MGSLGIAMQQGLKLDIIRGLKNASVGLAIAGVGVWAEDQGSSMI